MNVEFNKVQGIILGYNTTAIKVAYGGWLRLGLGEKIYLDKSQLKGKFHYECDISSINSEWRIIANEQIICGSGNEIEYCTETINKLSIGRIINFIELSKFDLRIVFDSGLIIDFFCNATDETNLSILDYKNNISYEFFHDGWEQTDASVSTQKLTQIEEVLNSLSEECQNRWQEHVPEKDDEKECTDCFYFRGLNGHFYFWDYGICSNKESKNDGKLVNVKSGCTKLKTLNEHIV
jgi:hypothetical protein